MNLRWVALMGAVVLSGCVLPKPARSQQAVPDQTSKPLSGAAAGSGPTFTVPDSELPRHWTVIAYGDTRFTNPANTEVTNPKVRRWLVDKIAAEHPDALLISGDLPYSGAVRGDYAVFRSETAAWRTEKLRVYPALGNHEMNGGEAIGLKNWWETFPELTGKRWYSVRFGSAYFITLDSNTELTEGSPQQMWLAGQLDHLPDETKFVILQLHHPPVADSIVPQVHLVRTNEAAVAKLLDAKAPKLKARLIVVAGHIHNYERFERDGVMYIVSGGGGAKPYPVRRDPDDLYKNQPEVNYNYVKFSFDGKNVNATMYRVDGEKDTPVWEAKDSFTITGR